MSKILIVVNAEVTETGKIIAASPATEQMIAALRRVIGADSRRVTSRKVAMPVGVTASRSPEPVTVEVVAAAALKSHANPQNARNQRLTYCPLTIELPDTFEFPAQSICRACKDIKGRRRWVEQHLGYATSADPSWFGHFWLPVVLTAKGPLYGEVIGEGEMPHSYEQPVDLPDHQRQSLYHLAYQLLQSLSALPAVYLLQFGFRGKEMIFDRLWPFPAAPAIASIGVQEPDLFACHWYSLTNQPILDLTIIGIRD